MMFRRSTTFFCRSAQSAVGKSSSSTRWHTSTAIVRDLSDSFVDALSSSQNECVDLNVAREQHRIYCNALERLGLFVDRLPPLGEEYPDACFVEDTAIVIGQQAVLLRPGHPSRRNEVESVGVALKRHGVEIVHDMRQEMEEGATCDGGDILCVGDQWVFCGLSERTTQQGADILSSSFRKAGSLREFVPVVHRDFLHLKSAATAIAGDAVLVHTQATDAMVDLFRSKGLYVYMINDSLACNVMLVNDTIVAQEKVSADSLKTLEQAAKDNNMDLIQIDTSELAKKDAALTCCSILIEGDENGAKPSPGDR